MTFAERIRSYRRENNLSQQKLAEMIGVSQPQIVKYESGSYFPREAIKNALVNIGFPKDELFDSKGDIQDMATDEQKDTAEQLVAICRLVVQQSYKMPSMARVNALKAAVADYEAALAKPECTDKGART